jgi:hypothetical protein
MVTTTNAAITANFPYSVHTALGTANTDPTLETLGVVQVQLDSNAVSINSGRGDGVNGHLALTITMADYALCSLNHVAFKPPMNPKSMSKGFLEHAADATSSQIA